MIIFYNYCFLIINRNNNRINNIYVRIVRITFKHCITTPYYFKSRIITYSGRCRILSTAGLIRRCATVVFFDVAIQNCYRRLTGPTGRVAITPQFASQTVAFFGVFVHLCFAKTHYNRPKMLNNSYRVPIGGSAHPRAPIHSPPPPESDAPGSVHSATHTE